MDTETHRSDALPARSLDCRPVYAPRKGQFRALAKVITQLTHPAKGDILLRVGMLREDREFQMMSRASEASYEPRSLRCFQAFTARDWV